MKVIIAGSRSIHDFNTVFKAVIESGFEVTEVVSGGASGVDQIGEKVFWDLVPVTVFLPDWKAHGKYAGIIRNRQMAYYADALVAIWDGDSKGTANMIAEMEKLGKPVYVWNTKERPTHHDPL